MTNFHRAATQSRRTLLGADMQKFDDCCTYSCKDNNGCPVRTRRVRAGKPAEADWPSVDDLPIQYAGNERQWQWMDVVLFAVVAGLSLAGFTKFVGWW